MTDGVTVVIPNWNTGPLLRLCLASLLRWGSAPAVVVVDNASSDASRRTAEAAAARGLIRLIRRDDARNEGAADHGAALDAGLAATETPLLFTLDSDAWARRADWLAPWRAALGARASHAGATKFPSSPVKRVVERLRGRARPEASYVRPCHALYRTAALRAHGLSFAPAEGADGRWRTTGESLHERLLELGHAPGYVPHATVDAHVGHLRHATFVLNAPHFPTLRERARRRGEAKIRRLLASREARSLLHDCPIP